MFAFFWGIKMFIIIFWGQKFLHLFSNVQNVLHILFFSGVHKCLHDRKLSHQHQQRTSHKSVCNSSQDIICWIWNFADISHIKSRPIYNFYYQTVFFSKYFLSSIGPTYNEKKREINCLSNMFNFTIFSEFRNFPATYPMQKVAI